MILRPIPLLMLIAMASPSILHAQTQVLSSSPPVVEYQYQMYYERWNRGWPGPGLSIGGSLPSNSREGISSFYGVPFAVPLGAGVYMNPFAYSSRLPAVPGAPFNIGLSGSTTPLPADPRRIDQPVTPISQTNSVNSPGFGLQNSAMMPNVIRPLQAISSPESMQKSREMESFGDEKIQMKDWTQAYVNYRNAAMTANDRASAHVRLALVSTILRRYTEAVSEFKRAISLDPTTGKTGETFASILGSESQQVRKDVVNDVARWAREDSRNQDRLFLLGVILHFNEDMRASEVLQAALNVTGSGEHIVTLLSPVSILAPPLQTQPSPLKQDDPKPDPPSVNQLPTLHHQPLALFRS